jgi:hypothetical protein
VRNSAVCSRESDSFCARPTTDSRERRNGGGRNVTFPARQYSVNGERRSFALLRPTVDATGADRLRDVILDAYAAFEQDFVEESR